MHRLVPAFIQEKYLAGETTGSFSAVALFLDISGFTAITNTLMGHGRHGGEILANITLDIFDPLVQSVFENGGFVTNLAGDAFTAVFPADGYSSDAFVRALAAAWQMQALVAASAQQQTTYGDFPIFARVGLATGEVAWGIIVSPGKSRAAYYFQGSAIDGCSWAEKLARAGEVIADGATREALGPKVSADPVEDHFRITRVDGALPSTLPINLSPVDPDVVLRFFPPEALQQAVSGEFRQVVSMFVSLPTVQTAEQLAIFMQIVFDLLNRYGGLLNRLDFGDKGANLVLFWGAPIAYENDVTRALNFILGLQAQTVVPVNAGVTYRIAHGGYSGGTFAGEYTCHGRGVTLAARFMQTSPRGEVWVDEFVAEQAEHYFEIDFDGEMAFKGFAEAQKVFVLLERKQATKPFYEGAMVGRQDEQARLKAFIQPIWNGRYPGVMVIWGEPGIGKSRLLYSFVEHIESSTENEFSVFICQTDEILRESLNPFRYWLRSYFSQSEQQSDARNKRSFNRKLDTLIAATGDETFRMELDRTRSFLGALVNLTWPDSLYEQLDAQGRYENSFIALLTLLEAESVQQPVILLLEDAQWLDGDTEAFLRRLTRVLTQDQAYPIAIVAAARSEGDRTLLGVDISYQEIDLDQLSTRDLATLAAAELGSPVGAELLQLLADRAEGNPFFAEQILRYLQEQDLLRLVAGAWAMKSGREVALPSDVSAVLVARLDRLTLEVKDVVQTASVLGREFEIRLLVRMLSDDPRVREKVVRAEQLSIWSALNEFHYLFKHALLRDAAYHMQVRSRRQALHKVAAEALEELHDADLSPHYGELAYHAEQARMTEKARRYLKLAAETAESAYQSQLAIDYYSRALALTPEEDRENRYRLLQARESLHGQLGARQEQALDQELMSDLAEQLGVVSKKADVLIRKAWLAYWLADLGQTLETAKRALRLAESAGDLALVGRAHYLISYTLLQQAVLDDARTHAEGAVAAARDSNDSKGAANALNVLGLVSIAEGDYSTALVHVGGFLAESQKIGDWEREATALGNLGVAYMVLGQYAEARQVFERALTISREIGSRSWSASTLVNLSWLATTQGEWESAVRHAEEGLAISREIMWIELDAEATLWLGHAWMALGKTQQASDAYRQSLKLRRKLGQENLAMGVLAGLARLALAQDDLDSAKEYVAEIIAHLDSGGSLDGTWEPMRIFLTCYQVLQKMKMQDVTANELLKTAYQQLQERANKISDGDMRRTFLENVPWNRDVVAAHNELDSR